MIVLPYKSGCLQPRKLSKETKRSLNFHTVFNKSCLRILQIKTQSFDKSSNLPSSPSAPIKLRIHKHLCRIVKYPTSELRRRVTLGLLNLFDNSTLSSLLIFRRSLWIIVSLSVEIHQGFYVGVHNVVWPSNCGENLMRWGIQHTDGRSFILRLVYTP